MHAKIVQTLERIERDNNVQILFASESGSRAWGFPSPDSDYDVRFVYLRPLDWYLSIDEGRDVIELPIDEELDVNGWDIKKALDLLLNANPVLLEWLSSPIRYRWNDQICAALQDLARDAAYGTSCRHHYLRLARRQWERNIDGKDNVNMKHYFYVVRPGMALRWLRMQPDRLPPMAFNDLLDGIDLPSDLVALLRDLLAKKSRTKELGNAPRIPMIDQFVLAEMDLAQASLDKSRPVPTQLRARADLFFRALVTGGKH